MAIETENKQLLVMNFPRALWTSPDTRAVEGTSREPTVLQGRIFFVLEVDLGSAATAENPSLEEHASDSGEDDHASDEEYLTADEM